jgi:hypothetical protein
MLRVANKPIILSVVMTNVVAPRLPKSYDNLESLSALITKSLNNDWPNKLEYLYLGKHHQSNVM